MPRHLGAQASVKLFRMISAAVVQRVATLLDCNDCITMFQLWRSNTPGNVWRILEQLGWKGMAHCKQACRQSGLFRDSSIFARKEFKYE
jgi:hypothetical protein